MARSRMSPTYRLSPTVHAYFMGTRVGNESDDIATHSV